MHGVVARWVMCHWIGSETENAVCRWGRYIRWRSFLPYEIRKVRASRAGWKRKRESDKEVRRKERKAMREGGIEGVTGQWSVNHRHGVMTRLSFQRLHRRKSSVRNYRPLSLVSSSYPGTPSPRANDRLVFPIGIDIMAPGIRRILR